MPRHEWRGLDVGPVLPAGHTCISLATPGGWNRQGGHQGALEWALRGGYRGPIMRLALLSPEFSPRSPWGVHQYHWQLAQALQAQGVQVEVWAPRDLPGLAPMGQRRVQRNGIGITWVSATQEATASDWEIAFRAFLDHEAPDLVHFLWLPEGAQQGRVESLVSLARERGLATIYHAQDYGALGRDAMALAADTQPVDADDWEARARTRLVQDLLDQHPALGEHGGHLLPNQVDQEFWRRLQFLLGGAQPPGLESAREAVQAERAQRRQAVQGMHARFANSKELAAELENLVPATFDVIQPGVNVATYAKLAAPVAGHGPLRLGYIGPMEMCQGVHLLLDAFEGLGSRAELRLFGSGSNRRYLRTLRARAQEVGARWYGDLAGEDRVHAMERIDVLVVPTLWNQSAPFEVREAFAAGRPVIVANHPALAAAVVDRENGLHFEAGQVDSLRAALECLVEEPELLARLQVGVVTPRDIAVEAGEWSETYKLTLAAARGGAKGLQGESPLVPPHLAALAERYEAWQALPTRDLFAKVVQGLQGLAGRMGVETHPLAWLSEAVAAGGHGRDASVTLERVQRWMEEQREAPAEAPAAGERFAFPGEESAPEPDLDPATHLPSLDIPSGDLEQVRRWVAQVHAQRAQMETRMQQLEFQAAQRIERQRATQGRLLEREQTMRQELARLARRLMTDAEAPVREGEAIAPDNVASTFAALHVIVRRSQEEMAWRRAEMAKAKGAAGGFFARLIGEDANAVVQHWDEIPLAPEVASEKAQTAPPEPGEASGLPGGPAEGTQANPAPATPPAQAQTAESLRAE